MIVTVNHFFIFGVKYLCFYAKCISYARVPFHACVHQSWSRRWRGKGTGFVSCVLIMLFLRNKELNFVGFANVKLAFCWNVAWQILWQIVLFKVRDFQYISEKMYKNISVRAYLRKAFCKLCIAGQGVWMMESSGICFG